jgi:chemotaxis protein methyltransferase CheR
VTILPVEFEFLRKIVECDSAIVLDETKNYLIESRLVPIAKEAGLNGISELVNKLKIGGDKELRRQVIEAMTTNETSFFRDGEPFEVLQEEILPELIEKRKAKKELRIWCAAASTGQEPYSLCMLMRDNFPELLNWKIDFVATDINLEVLEQAKSGIYNSVEMKRGLTPEQVSRHFTQVGTSWQISEELRNMVQFKPLNLIQTWPNIGMFDFVFIRNVLIYFSLETKKEIIAKIRKVLQPDGYLFLGTAETTINIDPNFERRIFLRTSCYKMKRGPL